MAWQKDVSNRLYDLTGGILGSPTKAVQKELTDREKLIKQKQRQTAAESEMAIKSAQMTKPKNSRYQLTASEALIPGVQMTEDKYEARTPDQIAAAEARQGAIVDNVATGVGNLTRTGSALMPMGAKVVKDLWEGGSASRQVAAPTVAAFYPESAETEDIGKASIQDVAAKLIETNTDEKLKSERGLDPDDPAPADITYGKGDGVNTDKTGKPTPESADDDAAQNQSASGQAAKNLQNASVKEDDDNKVGQGVLGDATQSWWFNVTDTVGDALINYGIGFAASGGDRGKAFASAGQTFANGFDKYDRRQQIQDLRGRGYSDAEIINYINSGQIAKPIGAAAGSKKGMTEAQQKAQGGAARALFINKTWGDKYGTLSSTGDYPLATRTGQIRGMFDEDGTARKVFDLADPEYGKAFKDEMGYLAGVLRPESGSAIGKMEWENYGHIYFPRYGDTQEDIARKNLLRNMTISTLQSAGDPSDAEAANMVDELTTYADKVVDFDPEMNAYILNDGNYLIID